MALFVDIVGWIGTACIILAYILVSHKKVTGDSKFYQLLNLIGACGVGIYVFYQGAWSSVVLQIVWGVVAVIGLLKMKK